MEERRKMLIACAGKLPPEIFFSGGELITLSETGTVPYLPLSEIPEGKAVYLLGFSQTGADALGNNFCVYKYKRGLLKQICSSGCGLTAKAVDGVLSFCFDSPAQGKWGVIAALQFASGETAAERLFTNMKIEYYESPKTYELSAEPFVSATQLQLPSALPQKGDILFLVSQAPFGNFFGVSCCGENRTRELLCGDNKLMVSDGIWGAAGVTAAELPLYSDFSIYEAGNCYARILGISFG